MATYPILMVSCLPLNLMLFYNKIEFYMGKIKRRLLPSFLYKIGVYSKK